MPDEEEGEVRFTLAPGDHPGHGPSQEGAAIADRAERHVLGIEASVVVREVAKPEATKGAQAVCQGPALADRGQE